MEIRAHVRKHADRMSTTDLSDKLFPGDDADSKAKHKRGKMAISRLAKDGLIEAEKKDRKWVIYASGKTIRGLKEAESLLHIAADDIEAAMHDSWRRFQDKCGRERRQEQREERRKRYPKVVDIHRNGQVLQNAHQNAPRMPKNQQNQGGIRHKNVQGNSRIDNSAVVQQTQVGVRHLKTQTGNQSPALNNPSNNSADTARRIQQNDQNIAANSRQIQSVTTQIANMGKQVSTLTNSVENLTERVEVSEKELEKAAANLFLQMSTSQQKKFMKVIGNERLLNEVLAQASCQDLRDISEKGLKEALATALEEEIKSLKENKDPEKRSHLANVLDDKKPLWQRIAKGTFYVAASISTALVLFEVAAAIFGFSGLLVKRGGAHAASQLNLAAEYNSEHNPNYAN